MQMGGIVVFNTVIQRRGQASLDPCLYFSLSTRPVVLQADFYPYLYIGIQGTEASNFKTQLIAVASASWFSSHSVQYFIPRLLLFAFANFKLCNDLEAKIAHSVQYLGWSNRSFCFSELRDRMWGEPSFILDGYQRRSRQDVEMVTLLHLVPSLRMRAFALPPSHVYVWLARGLFSFTLLMVCALLHCSTVNHTAVL